MKPGQTNCLLGASPEAADAIHMAAPEGVFFAGSLHGPRPDLVLFWPEGLSGLEERFRYLQERIESDGAIWAVIPKKKFAAAWGISMTWEQLQAVALRTDLVDNKIASFLEQEYGTRFVIRKDRRDQFRRWIDEPPARGGS